MSEIRDILALHDQIANSGQQLALATVISTDGPSYRSPGSRSLIVEDGKYGGGVSAGCLEGDIACRLDGNKTPFILSYDLSEHDDLRGFPFGCGGTVEIFVEPLPDARALNAVRWLSELTEPAVMLTVVKAEPGAVAVGSRFGKRSSTDRAYLDLCGESSIEITNQLGYDIELASLNVLEKLCDQLMAEKKSCLRTFVLHNQQISVFAEYFEPSTNLIIFGDNEDARILEMLADTVGMSTSRISRHDVRTSVNLQNELPSLEHSYIVVMTHDLNLDTKILKVLVPANPRYLGIMGPKSRTKKILVGMVEDADEVLERANIYAPVGLNIAAETPAEIALSIVAEIQAVSRKASSGHLRDATGAIHERQRKAKLRAQALDA